MKKLLFIALSFLLFGTVHSQMAGYAGKRVLIKADLLEGRYAVLSALGVEYMINRKLSFTVGYKYFNSNVNQSYINNEYTNGTSGGSISAPAEISTRALEFEARVYHNNPMSLGAPDGFFNYINLRTGQFDVNKGKYYNALFERDDNRLVDYTYKNINFWTFEFGLGLQKLINKWLTAGGKFGMNYTSINAESHEEFDTQKVVSGVAQQYGSNLFSIPRIQPGPEPTKSNIGFSLTLQIGFLIY